VYQALKTEWLFLDHFIDHRPKEPILFLTMPITAALEIFIVVVHYLAQGRIGRLSGGGISVEH
jgi:hypothetical protein